MKETTTSTQPRRAQTDYSCKVRPPELQFPNLVSVQYQRQHISSIQLEENSQDTDVLSIVSRTFHLELGAPSPGMSQADYNLSPPFDPPIADDEDESLAWYWEETGGGFPMTFGKYDGRHMNELSLSYLLFVRENSRREDFCEAFDIYHVGLKSAVQDEYGRFKVPFGRKHIGQTIRQCRDKQWLLWASRRSNLPAKHPLFFEAVEEWFANPRHYEVLRDIGESTRHDYEADLGDDEEPTPEDEEFIDDASLTESEEDAESESEEDAEATESESGDTDETSGGSSTQMEPMKSRELSRSTKRRRTSSESSSESDGETDQPPLNKKSRKGRRLPVLSSPEESEN